MVCVSFEVLRSIRRCDRVDRLPPRSRAPRPFERARDPRRVPQDPGCRTPVVPHQTEQQVLGPDGSVPEVDRLAKRELERLLRSRCEGTCPAHERAPAVAPRSRAPGRRSARPSAAPRPDRCRRSGGRPRPRRRRPIGLDRASGRPHARRAHGSRAPRAPEHPPCPVCRGCQAGGAASRCSDGRAREPPVARA